MGGIIVSTLVVAKFLHFKKVFIVSIWGNVAALVLIEIGLLDKSNVIFYIGYLMQGFFLGAIQVLIYEL